jgi:hypothetical protein
MTLHNSAFEMYKDDNFPRLENKTSNRLAKEFTIIIDDSDRPILPGEVNRTWFCRCELELFADHYMFKRKLCVYFPEDYDITKILRLLRHPYFVGAPPKLSIDDKSYSIQFEKGTGYDLGMGADEDAATGVMKTLIKIQKILKFLNENEFDLDTEKTYMKLENMLVSCFVTIGRSKSLRTMSPGK